MYVETAETWRAWIQALAPTTVGGIAAFFAYKAWKREGRRDDERHLREERAAQADLVAAWMELEGTAEIKSDDDVSFFAQIDNRSPLPVYEVELGFHVSGSVEPIIIWLGTIPPGTQTISFNGFASFTDQVVVDPLLQVGVSVEFTDTAGRRWTRSAWTGELSRS